MELLIWCWAIQFSCGKSEMVQKSIILRIFSNHNNMCISLFCKKGFKVIEISFDLDKNENRKSRLDQNFGKQIQLWSLINLRFQHKVQ